MIECIFTLDYEIYGDGTGELRALVYEPARALKETFKRWGARFVTFVEVAELEKIEAGGTDAAIDLVKRQIHDLHRDGFELGLHLHPQWANAQFENRRWVLDFTEYNLCVLPRPRMIEIVGRGVEYLRHVVSQPRFTPLSFRAGNWLFQPTAALASVLAEKGIKVDSSVFKGGVQRSHGLDYRPALNHGYYWTFRSDVNRPDPDGEWVELPIHTELVPFWRMATSKRLGLRRNIAATAARGKQRPHRLLDFLRFRYPLKLDFCRMTLDELTTMMERVLAKDRGDPATYRPIVAIGHTKDLNDLETVDGFLSFLRARAIEVSTFEPLYSKLRQAQKHCDGSGEECGRSAT